MIDLNNLFLHSFHITSNIGRLGSNSAKITSRHQLKLKVYITKRNGSSDDLNLLLICCPSYINE